MSCKLFKIIYFIIIFFLTSCAGFKIENEADFIKVNVVKDIFKYPHRFVEIINSQPFLPEIERKEIPKILLEYTDKNGKSGQEIIFLDEFLSKCEYYKFLYDEKIWVHSGGGYRHIYHIEVKYKKLIFYILVRWIYGKDNMWHFSNIEVAPSGFPD